MIWKQRFCHCLRVSWTARLSWIGIVGIAALSAIPAEHRSGDESQTWPNPKIIFDESTESTSIQLSIYTTLRVADKMLDETKYII